LGSELSPRCDDRSVPIDARQGKVWDVQGQPARREPRLGDPCRRCSLRSGLRRAHSGTWGRALDDSSPQGGTRLLMWRRLPAARPEEAPRACGSGPCPLCGLPDHADADVRRAPLVASAAGSLMFRPACFSQQASLVHTLATTQPRRCRRGALAPNPCFYLTDKPIGSRVHSAVACMS
jgi:hypothetical protein